MSLFSSNNYWKFVLMVLGAAILAATIIYSNFLAEKLKKNEEKNIILYTEAIKGLIKLNDQETYDENYWEFINTVKDSFPLPVIYEDENGELEGLNFKKENLNNQEFLIKKRDEFLASGEVPISGKGYVYCAWILHFQFFPKGGTKQSLGGYGQRNSAPVRDTHKCNFGLGRIS